ncbi:MAG TPA: CAP domain-containing protein [Opitutaceae bacterium]
MRRPWLAATLILIFSVPLAEGSARRPPELERWSYAEFTQHPQWQASVDWAGFDAPFLAAAIFHETNRVRAENGIRRLRWYRGLAAAADIQASMNAFTGTSTHANPLAGRGDVAQRVNRAGITARSIAENVAMTPARTLADGRPRLAVDDAGRRVIRDPATGSELQWPTYAELAARIVQQWMNSPGHRANLLSRSHTHLACGASMARAPNGVEQVYAVQVFLVPVGG